MPAFASRRLETRLLGWLGASATTAVPQAAAPIVFALIALPLTGSPSSGAALVLAMTTAQVLAAVPVTRLGSRIPSLASVKVLAALRTVALAALALLAGGGAPFWLLVVAAALAGLVSGAVFGHLRAALNHLVGATRLPRMLGIAATLNEVVFVLSPAVSSALGAVSPQLALWIVVALGAAPILLMPSVPTSSPPAALGGEPVPGTTQARRPKQRLSPLVALWLACSAASSSAVAAVETGAVSIAVALGMPAAWGAIFPVALCLASVSGGVWVSVRNRRPRLRTVAVWLLITAAGAALVGLDRSVALTLAGAVLVGGVLTPLGTHYSLALDALAPVSRRAEVFAMLRTASSVGVIIASGLLSVLPVAWALRIIPMLPMLALTALVIATLASRRGVRDVRDGEAGSES